jgi:PPK2 family polyphosphate:nucleotide phosphotransferase
MSPKTLLNEARQLAAPYQVKDGRKFKLQSIDPSGTGALKSKRTARAALQNGIGLLSTLQERLYASNNWSLLLIFQAMDAAGKDSAIKHVLSGINPQGCQIFSFKAPSSEELDHDYLWRCLKRLPERGRIGIFNRSYYEEVLIVRVHQHLLENQRIPPTLVTPSIWQERFEDIKAVERYLTRNGTVIRKFFLHLSPAEQKKRFLQRLKNPDKNWKFSLSDVRERQHWNQYTRAYEEMIRQTATPHAPWYVVPADHKWFTRLVVAAAVIDTLSSLDLQFPAMDPKKQEDLAAARKLLLEEPEL